MTARARVPLAITAACAVVAALVYADVDSPVRSLIVLAFLLVVPGLALVRPLGLREPVAELSLAVALSIAISVLVPTALLYGSAWSPGGALAIVLGLTVAGAAVELAKGRCQRAP